MQALTKKWLALFLAGTIILATTGAWADDDDDDKPGAAGAVEVEGIETENIFGYTLGTDTGEKGEKELTFTLDGRLGKGGQRYNALAGEAEFEYAVTDDLKLSLGAALNSFDISRVPGLDDTNGGGIGGAFFEVKYRFLDYRTAPFGLSLSIEPEWARYDEVSGESGTAYGIEFRLAADKELIKDVLFGAVNIVYEPEWERDENDLDQRIWASGSGLEVSAALTAQVVKDVFLGGEIRYLASYDGNFLNSREGWGLFMGPTLYAQLTEAWYVKAAWSIQLTGDSPDSWNSALDLADFERQQARLQVGVQF